MERHACRGGRRVRVYGARNHGAQPRADPVDRSGGRRSADPCRVVHGVRRQGPGPADGRGRHGAAALLLGNDRSAQGRRAHASQHLGEHDRCHAAGDRLSRSARRISQCAADLPHRGRRRGAAHRVHGRLQRHLPGIRPRQGDRRDRRAPRDAQLPRSGDDSVHAAGTGRGPGRLRVAQGDLLRRLADFGAGAHRRDAHLQVQFHPGLRSYRNDGCRHLPAARGPRPGRPEAAPRRPVARCSPPSCASPIRRPAPTHRRGGRRGLDTHAAEGRLLANVAPRTRSSSAMRRPRLVPPETGYLRDGYLFCTTAKT